MPRFRIIMFLPLISALAAQTAPRKPAPAAPPNVFLVTIDTLRADHVHCYGYNGIATPALDGLARDGYRFAQAFTPSPITNTSHTSILTGLLPGTHGVTDFAVPLASGHSTWAELLAAKGYHSAAFIGAVILDSQSLAPGLNRGFDFYDNFPAHAQTKARWGRVERRGMDVVQHAEAWLTAHPTGPRFVWVHLYDPHDPYEPPPPYSQTYKDRLYDGEIAYADSALAHFIRYLKQHALYDNSIVVTVGDHGEGLGQHHEDTHGIFLYDSTTHVPLIIKLPRAAATTPVIDAQVRTIDILPTVLDLLNIPPPARLDGQSLKPYLAGTETAGLPSYSETDYPLRFGWAPLRSVRAGGFKFIEAPHPELYDLHADPGELSNAYQPWDSVVKKFRSQLAEVRANTPPAAPSEGAVGQGTIDELKALGYLGSADAGSATNVPEPSLLPDPKDKIGQQNLLHTAMMAAEDNRPAEARTAFEQVLKLDPDSVTALRQLGHLELRAAEYAPSAAHLKHAREIRPGDAASAFDEGQAWQQSGNLVAARQALEDSLKSNAGQFPARLLLGQVCLQIHDLAAAADQFEAALLLQPQSLDATLGLAAIQLAENKFAEALALLQPLAKSSPTNANVFDLLAKTYQAQGRDLDAQRAQATAARLRARPPH